MGSRSKGLPDSGRLGTTVVRGRSKHWVRLRRRLGGAWAGRGGLRRWLPRLAAVPRAPSAGVRLERVVRAAAARNRRRDARRRGLVVSARGGEPVAVRLRALAEAPKSARQRRRSRKLARRAVRMLREWEKKKAVAP